MYILPIGYQPKVLTNDYNQQKSYIIFRNKIPTNIIKNTVAAGIVATTGLIAASQVKPTDEPRVNKEYLEYAKDFFDKCNVSYKQNKNNEFW